MKKLQLILSIVLLFSAGFASGALLIYQRMKEVDRLRLETIQTIENGQKGFTLVYAPGEQQSGQSPLQLLNLLKPGLGAALASAAPQQPAAMQLRYILPGHVSPAVQPTDGARFIYVQQ